MEHILGHLAAPEHLQWYMHSMQPLEIPGWLYLTDLIIYVPTTLAVDQSEGSLPLYIYIHRMACMKL